MGFFSKKDEKVLKLTEQARQERLAACQKEINEILIKYNCQLQVIVQPK